MSAASPETAPAPRPFGPLSYGSDGALQLSGVALAPLAAQYGSPLYVYSGAHISVQILSLIHI